MADTDKPGFDIDAVWEKSPEEAIRRAMAVVRPGYRMWTGLYLMSTFGSWSPGATAALIAFVHAFSPTTGSPIAIGILAAVSAVCAIFIAQFDPKQEATRYQAAVQYCWMARNAHLRNPENDEALALIRRAIGVITPDVRVVLANPTTD